MLLAALVVTAVVLAWPVPQWLPSLQRLRRVPGPALLLWQAVSLAAVLAGLALAPLAILESVRRGETLPAPSDNLGMLLLGLAISGLIAARLLLRGHRVGTALRRARREHRELLDLLAGSPRVDLPRSEELRVLTHPTPTAYCVPGVQRRVVLSDSTVDTLSQDELDAVMAHEWAHLRLRHDLVLEFFTVLHTAVPRRWRSARGLDEVHLLIELLADRSAARRIGRVPVARALVALAEGDHPDAALGYDGAGAVARLAALRDERPRRVLAVTVTLVALVVLALPVVLEVLVVLP